jgi:hypothetical protein
VLRSFIAAVSSTPVALDQRSCGTPGTAAEHRRRWKAVWLAPAPEDHQPVLIEARDLAVSATKSACLSRAGGARRCRERSRVAFGDDEQVHNGLRLMSSTQQAWSG